jgi:5-enolpyruvylshikimate-3-phosphate synthase
MGARVEAVDGHPPLTVHGAAACHCARAGDASAQVKARSYSPGYAEGGQRRRVAATRDHTERALAAFGGVRCVG